jgi:hypothetical protein
MKTTFLIFLVPFIFLFSSCRKDQTIQSSPIEAHRVESFADEIEYLYRTELLPQYRENTEVAQVSSYDTTGGNNDGFSGLYSYLRKEGDRRIIAELQGPGIIERIWTPTPSEDTIQFYFDGEPDPRISLRFIDLFTGDHYPFINPIVGNEIGGYYSYLPIPYQQSCKIVYIGDELYFHQIQYRKLDETAGLPSFRMELEEQEKIALEKAAGLWDGGFEQLHTRIDSIYYNQRQIIKSQVISPGEKVTLADINEAGRIVKFMLEFPDETGELLKDLLIRIHWDDEDIPAVYSPAADFFGYAFGNPSARSLLLGSESGRHYCFLPMPFDKNAKFELIYAEDEKAGEPVITFRSVIGFIPVKRDPEIEGKFYTEWNRIIGPEPGKPYVLQETGGKGHHVGTILQARGLRPGMTHFFEGDDSTLVDHTLRLHGTGSEDYFNGGWYALPNRWDQAFSLPIHGCLEYSIPLARTGGYRFYLADKINFKQHFLHTIEHGPQGNQYPVDYTSIAFYYCNQPPTAFLEPRAELRKIYFPDTLVITPDLMKVTIGLFNASSRIDWGKFRFYGDEKSIMVIHLDEIPRGDYRMYLSFFRGPNGCDFSVWQRQHRVSGAINARTAKEEAIEDFYVGDIRLDENYPSVTLMKESPEEERELIFSRMMFVKKMDQSE